MSPAALLSLEAVFPRIGSSTKKQALRFLSEEAEQLTGMDAAYIFSVLMDREHVGCTGVGEGVCIPHGRFDEINRVYVLASTLETPVEFGAADDKPVDIIFLLLSPRDANTEHLKAMATISRLLRDKPLCQAIRAAKTSEDMHGILTYERS